MDRVQINCSSEIISALNTLLRDGKRPNFIFCGDSVLHVAVFNSFLLKMQSQGIRMCGVVCNCIPDDRIKQFNKDDIRAIPDDDFIYFDEGFSYFFENSSRTSQVLDLLWIMSRRVFEPKKHADNSDDFYIVIPANGARFSIGLLKYLISLNRPIMQVTLEEGIGSYLMEDVMAMERAFVESRNPQVSRLAKAKHVASRLYQGICNTELSKHISHEDMLILQKDEFGRLRTDQETCDWVKKGLSLSKTSSSINGRYAGRAVILLTNLFWRYHHVPLEMDILKTIITILDELQIEVIVRPHPRCSDMIGIYESLGVDIDTSSEAFEATLMNSGEPPLLTLGFCSSSQIFANALWDIPSFSLGGFIDSCSETIGDSEVEFREQMAYINKAEAAFADYIEAVNTPDSLREKIIEKGIGAAKDSK